MKTELRGITPLPPNYATPYLSPYDTTLGLVEQHTERRTPDASWDVLTLGHHRDATRFSRCQGNGDAEARGPDLRVPVCPQRDEPVQTGFSDGVRRRLP